MNKLIDGLFEKDSLIKAISILMAILIWFFVMDQDNPFEERTITVSLSNNSEVLQDNNFEIVGSSIPQSIDIKIKGRRQKISGVTANDFKAQIDLSNITDAGIKRINIDTINYNGKNDIIISGVNPSYINIQLEKVVGKQYPVTVAYKGKLPENYELVNLKIEPENIILEEKESSLSKVSKVIANIDLDSIKDNNEIIMKATVLDSDGKQLKQFDGKIPLIATFNLAKKVPVIASIKGEPQQDWYFKEIQYSLPSVRVLGVKSVLESVIKLTAEPIDITGQTGTVKSPLVVNIPKDSTIMKEDYDALSCDVILDRLITRKVNVPASVISIYEIDTTGSKKYSVTNVAIPIEVKGRPDYLNSLKTSDIKLSVHVNNLEAGTHEVPLTVQLPNNIDLVGEYKVNIIIENITFDEESDMTNLNYHY